MKKSNILILLLVTTTAMAFAIYYSSGQQNSEPWSEEQLMEPAELAEILNDPSNQNVPLILAVNPDGMYGLPHEGGIKEAQWFGPAEKEKNLNNLEAYLENIDKDEEIVVYCGCCPFDLCPNIRPAFNLLNTMGFTNHKLLHMPKNLNVDWISRGYPMKSD